MAAWNVLYRRYHQSSVEIAARRKQEVADLKARIADMAKAGGYTVSDLFGLPGKSKIKPKMPGKFVHPTDPTKTWSGRGRRPGWFVEQASK